jgi:hypothetical protein
VLPATQAWKVEKTNPLSPKEFRTDREGYATNTNIRDYLTEDITRYAEASPDGLRKKVGEREGINSQFSPNVEETAQIRFR